MGVVGGGFLEMGGFRKSPVSTLLIASRISYLVTMPAKAGTGARGGGVSSKANIVWLLELPDDTPFSFETGDGVLTPTLLTCQLGDSLGLRAIPSILDVLFWVRRRGAGLSWVFEKSRSSSLSLVWGGAEL